MSAHLQVDQAQLAADLEVLGTTALRLAANLRSGLADLGQAGPDRGVGANPNADATGVVSAAQLAELLGVNVRTLRRMRLEGRAPKALRGKGPLRWRRSDVERWMQEQAS